MNSYATEQLMRQRHAEFAREAQGDNLIRLARNAATVSQADQRRAPVSRSVGLAQRLWMAALATSSRVKGAVRGFRPSPVE